LLGIDFRSLDVKVAIALFPSGCWFEVELFAFVLLMKCDRDRLSSSVRRAKLFLGMGKRLSCPELANIVRHMAFARNEWHLTSSIDERKSITLQTETRPSGGASLALAIVRDLLFYRDGRLAAPFW
jgi:hypothetical protein